MALDFPASASVGQYYRDGVSALYQYNGSYWTIVTGSRAASLVSATSASYTPSHRRNITQLGDLGYSGHLLIADGKLFAHKSIAGYNFNPNGSYSTDVALGFMPGSENLTEIVFPGETGNLIESNIYGNSAYALFDNGDLYTWGSNTYGQLGLGNTTFSGLPRLSNTNVTKVWWNPSMTQGSADYSFLVVQKTDGFCYGAGYNAQGQLGIGNTTNQTSWVQIPGIGQNPKFVGVIGNYVGGQIVQKADNTIVVCGWNTGELGIGNTTQQTSFATASLWIAGDSTMLIQGMYAKCRYVTDAGGNDLTTVLLWLSNGTTDILRASGNNNWGQLGDGTTTARTSPVSVQTPSGKRIQKIVNTGNVVGAYHVLFTDGTVYGWGRANESQLGDGTTTTKNSPVLIHSNVLDIYQTAASFRFFTNPGPIIKKADGYYTWGQNDFGTVGDGTATVRTSPVKMRLPQGVNIKFFGGATGNDNRYYKIAITDDNRYYAWGSNSQYAVHAEYSTDVLVPTEFTPRALVR
jgi:alpha-tubulin suppressor-like RCC1 family protein